MRLRILGIIIPIIIVAFAYGVAVGLYEYFPYEGLSQTKKIILNEDTDEPVITSTSFEKFDAGSIIKIETTEDLNSKKTSLVKYIWKGEMPTKLPTNIEENFIDDSFSDIKDLKQLDKITIEMEHGVNSVAYFFIPYEPNNKLIVYHHGHAGDFILEKKTLTFFLDNGYSILGFNMPLKGTNNQPVIETSDFGPVKFSSHRQFPLLEHSKFSPMKYFVEPITLSLNYIDKNYDYDDYYMVGISGGGWTTILYSAIDERISQSYSVAGSYPIYLRHEAKNLGDYEQINPNLYKIANYLELYIMASYGNDRKLVQIFNKHDPCCFDGESYLSYETEVKRTVSNLQKGKFEIYLDGSHQEHKISEDALRIILRSMNVA
jgi:hypothetical protein